MLDRAAIASWSCCVLIAACAGVGEESKELAAPAVGITDPGLDMSVLLSSFQDLAVAPAAEQRKEYLAARQALAVNSNAINRLRLALAISLPAVSPDDESQGLKMLTAPPDISATQEARTPVAQLALLLCRQAQERHSLHEDQRQREAELHDKQRQIEDLRLKLDTLRRIDQDAMQRKHNAESPP